jgi:hypothetical protein
MSGLGRSGFEGAGFGCGGICPHGRAGQATAVVPPAAAGLVGPRRSAAGLKFKGARCTRVARDGLRPPLILSLAGRAVHAVRRRGEASRRPCGADPTNPINAPITQSAQGGNR